jgi:hypothetical protein
VGRGFRFGGALAVLVLAGSATLAGTTYIRAGQVFDGETLMGTHTIVLRDSLIDTLLPPDALVPEGATVLDATDQAVLPGFFAVRQLVATPRQWSENVERFGTGRLTVEELSAYPTNRFDLLANGVTTVLDIGSPFPVQLGLKKALARGSIIGPRLLAGGPLLITPGVDFVSTMFAGHHDWIDFATARVGDPTTARKRVDALARQGVDFVVVVHEEADCAPRPDEAVGTAVEAEAGRCSLGFVSLAGSEEASFVMERVRTDWLDSLSRFTSAGRTPVCVRPPAPTGLPARWDYLCRVAPGYLADLVFIDGDADTGRSSSERIKRVMLGGKTVIENGRVPKELAYGFRRTVLDGIAYPYWDPLLSFLIGGSITDYDLFSTGTTASSDILYSTRNMWFANVSFLPPSPIPRTGLRVAAHFDNQNRLFYGLGNDVPLDSAVEYRNVIFRELVGTATCIGREWKAAGSVFFDQTRLRQYGSKILPDGLAGRDGGNEVMVSLALAHDTRDHQVNPWYGHYVGAGVLAAPAVFPNGHAFGRAFAEARGYVSVAHHHILVGRAVYQQAFGDVPFYHLPEFGGDTLGRGYLPFRFRDRVAVIGQFEYRFPIWSSISGVAFVDVGEFQPGPGSLTIGGFHPSIGFGPRVCFGANESRMIGVDIGFTTEGWNLVLHNGQVF